MWYEIWHTLSTLPFFFYFLFCFPRGGGNETLRKIHNSHVWYYSHWIHKTKQNKRNRDTEWNQPVYAFFIFIIIRHHQKGVCPPLFFFLPWRRMVYLGGAIQGEKGRKEESNCYDMYHLHVSGFRLDIYIYVYVHRVLCVSCDTDNSVTWSSVSQ